MNGDILDKVVDLDAVDEPDTSPASFSTPPSPNTSTALVPPYRAPPEPDGELLEDYTPTTSHVLLQSPLPPLPVSGAVDPLADDSPLGYTLLPPDSQRTYTVSHVVAHDAPLKLLQRSFQPPPPRLINRLLLMRCSRSFLRKSTPATRELFHLSRFLSAYGRHMQSVATCAFAV
ncbi:hypothetical protein SARC_02696 [Sphaeroforma arctica JP610]|uniref:Uncharacterized protein n=1 Tax=Sphaeroforma arctica JP610 TaxID=667725 RepID=A0A0L0G8A6_9EUKA|nr:hypothetical protein SARC_02696 [Sphaeroforma arctica JP610]KNC85106.1 hypothetical protein SARC_02696 [Sphaeroforma arctica JP610]|eukprot:XP_014159008.1 hypothetical protein SARC_02696 [Sphaeroforma arctica JP610]